MLNSHAKKHFESEAFADSSELFSPTKNITVNTATLQGQVKLVAQTPPSTAELTAGDQMLL